MRKGIWQPFTFVPLWVLMVGLACGHSVTVHAQSRPQPVDPKLVEWANLKEDLALLRHQVAQMRLEVERLSRENSELRHALQVRTNNEVARQNNYVTVAQFNKKIISLQQELKITSSRQKAEIISEVSRQMERLAIQTEEAMKALAQSISEQSQSSLPSIVFSDDYPKQGVTYLVEPGDTLSLIALKFKATVDDIQSANKIADPTKLKAGQTIFIPQAKP